MSSSISCGYESVNDASQYQELRKRMPHLYPLLDLGEFKQSDIPEQTQNQTQYLVRNGFLKRIRYEKKAYGKRQVCDKIPVYRLDPEVERFIRDYRDAFEQLPCGHRVHIYNPSGVDGLSCRYCPDDSKPCWDKETIRELL